METHQDEINQNCPSTEVFLSFKHSLLQYVSVKFPERWKISQLCRSVYRESEVRLLSELESKKLPQELVTQTDTIDTYVT